MGMAEVTFGDREPCLRGPVPLALKLSWLPENGGPWRAIAYEIIHNRILARDGTVLKCL